MGRLIMAHSLLGVKPDFGVFRSPNRIVDLLCYASATSEIVLKARASRMTA